MKTKCLKCNGKGGWKTKTALGELFKTCIECLGKGSWFSNKRTNKKCSKQPYSSSS